jgi:hypothetical protein
MPDSTSYSRWLIGGLLVFACCAVGLGVWYYYLDATSDRVPDEETWTPDPPTPDPRLVFDTPFRNVKPDVKYVGDDACARCHLAIAKSYHSHPMGRSAADVLHSEPIERYGESGKTVFPSGVFDLEVERSAEAVWHRVRLREKTPEAVAEFALPAHVAIGSGTRGRSYLTVEDGAVWQTPVSWFGPDQRWDLSPGFRLGKSGRREILPACLYCHVDQVNPVPGAVNRYREPVFGKQLAIGCERCHGPGELHVAERSGAKILEGVDTSIVNPRHLTPALQSAICEQCHLQGEERVDRRGRDIFEYRPALPFEQFVSVHVIHPAAAKEYKSVGQFEQMEQSRCFTDAHYRQRCLTCHEPNACVAPAEERRTKNDSCIACHMPRAASANIMHASVTNHRVPRTPDAKREHDAFPVGTPPLVRFRAGPLSPSVEERERDLGIALARFAKKRPARELILPGELRSLATERLLSSLERWPGDAEAWIALASSRTDRAAARERLRAAKAAVSLAPNSETALAALTEAAVAAREFDLAIAAATNWIDLNPTGFDPIISRGFVNLERRDWDRAHADALAALRRHPLHPVAHLYLAICYHNKGDAAAGFRQAQTAARLASDPGEQQYLLEWYRRATR